MTKKMIGICLIGLVFGVSGCGGGSDGPPPAGLVAKAEPQTSFPELKKQLQDIANSGTKPEGFAQLQQAIDQTIRSTNATLADDLLKDFAQLSSASGASQIKEIAGKMAGKIP